MAMQHAQRLLRRRRHRPCSTEELARTSRLVSRLTGYPVQYNKAVVGRNAFAHEAGIHQHGVLEDRETYEIIDASTVGQEAAQIVLGKHSGRHAFADTLEKMGLHVQGDALNQAFVRFKELADRKVRDHRGRPRGDRRRGARHRHRAPVHDRRASSCTAAPRRRRPRTSCSTDGDGKVEADGDGQRHDRRRHRGDLRGDRRRGHGPRLQGVVGDRRWRRARRRRDPARGRRAARRRAAASPPTSSRRRPARTSTRSTRSCGCASGPTVARSPTSVPDQRVASTAPGSLRPGAVAPPTGSVDVRVCRERRAPDPRAPTSPSASATSSRSTASTSGSSRARRSASSARTAPARRRRCG